MPVKSYLAVPMTGKKDKMSSDINGIKGCETAPADNKDIVVVLTETATQEEDTLLYEKLRNLDTVQDLMLVSAFAE